MQEMRLRWRPSATGNVTSCCVFGSADAHRRVDGRDLDGGGARSAGPRGAGGAGAGGPGAGRAGRRRAGRRRAGRRRAGRGGGGGGRRGAGAGAGSGERGEVGQTSAKAFARDGARERRGAAPTPGRTTSTSSDVTSRTTSMPASRPVCGVGKQAKAFGLSGHVDRGGVPFADGRDRAVRRAARPRLRRALGARLRHHVLGAEVGVDVVGAGR